MRGAVWTRWQRALALAGGLMLSGCSDPIWLDHAGANGVTFHWYTREATIDEVSARAEAHCRRFDMSAKLLDESEDQDVTTAHFACG